MEEEDPGEYVVTLRGLVVVVIVERIPLEE